MNETAPYIIAVGEVLPELNIPSVTVAKGTSIDYKIARSKGGIQVRTPYDNYKDIRGIPFAYPLLPKTIQTPPKEGEAVLVIFMQEGNPDSDRFYLGPIISQKQYFYKESQNGGAGSPTNFLQGGSSVKDLDTLGKNKDITDGAFPKEDDVAIIGRKNTDAIFRDDEILLRCGIRQDAMTDDPNLQGKVAFNNVDPAYIQLGYGPKSKPKGGGKSVANIVAEKINLIGKNQTIENAVATPDPGKVKTDMEYLTQLMSMMHPSVYGDVLVEVLSLIIKCLVTHIHPNAPERPDMTDMMNQLNSYPLDTILSKSVALT